MKKQHRERAYDDLIPISDPDALAKYTDPTLGGGNETFPERITDKWNQQMGRSARSAHPLRPVSPNGRNEPHSIMAVVDAILRTDHRSFITANTLVGRMEADYPWIRWDPITVGRILHSIAELASENRGPEGQKAFWIIASNGLRNYVPPQDLVSWHWMGVLREKVGLEAAANALDDRNDEIWERLSEIRFGDRL